jgi:hypothetical protein
MYLLEDWSIDSLALRMLVGSTAELQKVTLSFVMFVRLSALNNSDPTGRIFMKFDIWVFFETLPRNFTFD